MLKTTTTKDHVPPDGDEREREREREREKREREREGGSDVRESSLKYSNSQPFFKIDLREICKKLKSYTHFLSNNLV